MSEGRQPRDLQSRFCLFVQQWEAVESVEAVNPTRKIFGLEHGAQLCPCHHAETAKHTTFDDRSLHWHHELEQLVHGEKSLEMIPSYVLGKILELGLDWIGALIEDALDIRTNLSLGFSA